MKTVVIVCARARKINALWPAALSAEGSTQKENIIEFPSSAAAVAAAAAAFILLRYPPLYQVRILIFDISIFPEKKSRGGSSLMVILGRGLLEQRADSFLLLSQRRQFWGHKILPRLSGFSLLPLGLSARRARGVKNGRWWVSLSLLRGAAS